MAYQAENHGFKPRFTPLSFSKLNEDIQRKLTQTCEAIKAVYQISNTHWDHEVIMPQDLSFLDMCLAVGT